MQMDPNAVLITHPDVASTINSAPIASKAAVTNSTPLAPGANQTLTVAGGNSSTANPGTDTNRRIAGQIPGTSVAFSNPA